MTRRVGARTALFRVHLFGARERRNVVLRAMVDAVKEYGVYKK